MLLVLEPLLLSARGLLTEELGIGGGILELCWKAAHAELLRPLLLVGDLVRHHLGLRGGGHERGSPWHQCAGSFEPGLETMIAIALGRMLWASLTLNICGLLLALERGL